MFTDWHLNLKSAADINTYKQKRLRAYSNWVYIYIYIIRILNLFVQYFVVCEIFISVLLIYIFRKPKKKLRHDKFEVKVRRFWNKYTLGHSASIFPRAGYFGYRYRYIYIFSILICVTCDFEKTNIYRIRLLASGVVTIGWGEINI